MVSANSSHKPLIWLLSAYRSDSHAAWADWLTSEHSHVNWQRLELSGRHFRWRIRGNPLCWINLPGTNPDLILATSMVDLATLKGLHPRLAHVPTWYYFHENQFAYPESERQFSSIDHQMVQIYGGLAADHLFFNSDFNRTSYLEGVKKMLHKKPDADAGLIRQRLEEKSTLLPIPVNPVPSAETKDEKMILWNHRWEYDKAPEVFCRALRKLQKKGVDFRLAILGGRSSRTPESLQNLRAELGDRIIIDDKVNLQTYREILGKSGIVVSTAIHEFQGLAMLEAASAGVRPLVPDALCYPEQYPAEYRYPPGDHHALANKLETWLTQKLPDPVNVSGWYSPSLYQRWEQLLNQPQAT